MEVKKIKKVIENSLNKNKANNIVTIDLKRKSYIADYMIVASGTSSRHLQSLSENLLIELKKFGLDNCRIEGYESNDWKLVDAIDVIVHLFHPEKGHLRSRKNVVRRFTKRKGINMRKKLFKIFFIFLVLLNTKAYSNTSSDKLYEKIDLLEKY